MNRKALDELKQQIPLLDYLQAQEWKPARALNGGRWMGLCPLHADHKPSFLVDPQKSLFYCYGCGRGGDVIRFAELYHQVKFPQALTLLREWCGLMPSLHAVVEFYRLQLHRRNEAVVYLDQRGIHSAEVIEHMRIGYAAGGGLRGWLTQLGYPPSVLRSAGLVTEAGYGSYVRRIIFPLESNLYGRSIRSAAPPHRFLPGSKGGLYSWEHARRYSEVILVEGLFDYAVVWQAGFRNVTCSLGNHLNARQFQQLCDGPRTVYLAFDADANGSGQSAAQSMSRRLCAQGISTRRVPLPDGHIQQLLCAGRRCATVSTASGCHSPMTFQVIHLPNCGARSPFHVVHTQTGRDVEWVNRFLDRECIRCLAETTLRSYAMDLLHFVRWWAGVHHRDAITKNALASVLTDYVRFQAGQRPRPAPATINRRVGAE